MNTAFFTFEKLHGKKNIGSTRIRVRNLLKHWPEAHEYKFGEKPDVMIFQKVYIQGEYRSHRFDIHNLLDCIKILDICDPDWLGATGLNKGCLIVETVNAVDAIVTPTEPLAEFIRQLTDKPVVVIKDRFIIDGIGAPRQHTGKAKKVIWYGYRHNAETLKTAMRVLAHMDLELTVFSDEDPLAWRWAQNDDYESKYHFVKYDESIFKETMAEHDICILPKGSRPVDRFKSDNKTAKAWLHGIPVATNKEELEKLMDPKERNVEALEKWSLAKKEYDAKLSVEEYKQLITTLSNTKNVNRKAE